LELLGLWLKLLFQALRWSLELLRLWLKLLFQMLRSWPSQAPAL
jgi:hypothetical protein